MYHGIHGVGGREGFQEARRVDDHDAHVFAAGGEERLFLGEEADAGDGLRDRGGEVVEDRCRNHQFQAYLMTRGYLTRKRVRHRTRHRLIGFVGGLQLSE